MAYPNQLSVEEMCKKLRPVLGPKVDKVFIAWRMAENPEKRMQVEHALNALYVKHLDNSMLNRRILLEPPSEEQVAGKYELGNVLYASKELYPFGLRDRDFPRHICITGMSGSGKTNLGFHLLKTLIDKDIPFLVFDWKKSFRQLMTMTENVLVFTVGNENIANLFTTNINEPPPLVGPKEWINIIADLVNEAFYASHGVHKLISETMDEAFKEFGVYKGSNNYPTWFQIKDRLEAKGEDMKQGREREWLTSALRIAHSLTFGGFGQAINSKDKYGFKIPDLLSRRSVFELHALGQSEKKFFCEYLLNIVYKVRKAEMTDERKEFNFAIIVDEAHNIFLKDKTFFLKESICESIYREIREYGVSLVCMDQHISKLSDVVPGNSACNIAFQQMLPQDIQTSSGVMQLYEKKEYFSMLPVGTAIVRLAERYHQPFLVKVPLVEMGGRVLDNHVIDSMTKILESVRLRKIIEDCKDDGTVEETIQPVAIHEGEPLIMETNLNSQTVQDRNRLNTHPVDMVPAEENRPLTEVEAADLRVKQRKQELEKKYQREQQKALDKIEERKRAEIEKAAQKEKRKIAVITNPKEQRTVPRHQEREAFDVFHGPEKFLTEETLGRSRRSGEFKPHEEEFPHLGNVLESSTQINKLQQQFIAAVGQNPTLSITQLYKVLGLSARKGNSIKDELVKKGYIEVVEEKSDKGWKKHLRMA